MSIVLMKKITLVAPLHNVNNILKTIQNSGLVHIIPIDDNRNELYSINKSHNLLLKTNNLLTLTSNALSIIKTLNQTNFSPVNDLDESENIWTYLEQIDKYYKQKKSILKSIDLLEKQIKKLALWGDFIPLKIKNIEEKTNFKIIFGTVEKAKIDKLYQENTFFEIINKTPTEFYVMLAYKSKIDLSVLKLISHPQYSLTQLKDMLKNNMNIIEDINKKFFSLISRNKKIQELHSRLIKDKEVLEAEKSLYMFKNLFGLQGYIPKKDMSFFLNLFKKENILIKFATPNIKDNVPVLLSNTWLFKGFESILKLFSGISYNEKDVTPIVGCLFIWFGSLCFVDAGYGLMLFFFGLILIKKNIKDFGSIAIITGLIATIVGSLNGQIFGLVVGQHIMKDTLPLFKLATDSLFCLTFSLYVGILIMGGSYLTSIWQKGWKTESTGSFLLTCTVIIFIVMEKYSVDIFFRNILISLMLCLTLCSWIMYHEMPFGKKIGDVLWVLYSGPTGLLQDVLSHMRLFGISLSGAILALVVNEISSMFPIYLQIPFCLFGHCFVFCLSLLSLYVHSNRLIFLEFGSNCIDGGHFYYLPLGRS